MIDIFPSNIQEYIKDSNVKFFTFSERDFNKTVEEKLERENTSNIRAFFIGTENKIYLKENASSSTIAHEVGHAIDWFLGDRQSRFLSELHSGILLDFRRAKQTKLFITEYSMKNVKEYFAEAFGAFLNLNDNKMICRADRNSLRIVSPFLENYFSRLFQM